MSTAHSTEFNRAEINRANSQHSTGPKSAEGKRKSSLNALRHGLTGQIIVVPTEDLHAYQRHLESFADEYRPKGPTEAHLVQALADTSWRLNRVAALETNVLTLGVATGSGPHTHAPQQIQDALAIAAALESQSKALSNLSMHSQRLSRQFERTIDKLHELQKLRRDREEQELENLLDVIEMYQCKGETFDHSAHGFVFSDPQILAGIRARNRESLIAKAYHYRGQSAA
jgi:hypothetical protein